MEAATPVNQSQPHNEAPRACRFGRGDGGHRRGVLFLVFLALIVGFAGGYVGRSYAQGFGHLHGPMGAAGADPARIDQHVERMVRHLAIEIDATPQQTEKLTAIAKSAARELLPLREQLAAAHKRAIGLMGAASVDRGAIEALRTEHLQLADAASKRLTQALADAMEVLTPAQRQKIAAHMEERVGRFGHGHRG